MRDHWNCLDEAHFKKGPKILLTLIIDTDENAISIGRLKVLWMFNLQRKIFYRKYSEPIFHVAS